MSETRAKILAVAERLIRSGGYNNCSFREIAAEIGLKSASIHHHFPAKADLAAAVARGYAERFFAALGDPIRAGSTPAERIAFFCECFRSAYASSGLACLCGVLASEAGLLPAEVKGEVAAFMEASVAWLAKALVGPNLNPGADTIRKARMIYAAMQGAMVAAKLNEDAQWLEDASLAVKESVSAL